MQFAHPFLFWLLPFAIVQAPIAWRNRHSIYSTVARVTCVIALLFALAEPTVLIHRNTKADPIGVIELGPNVDAAATIEAAIRSELTRAVVFSNRCEYVDDLSSLRGSKALADCKSRIDQPEWPDDNSAGGTALASALALAGAKAEAGSGAIHLLSTGGQSRGDAEGIAFQLAGHGTAIHATKLPARLPEIALRTVNLPARAKPGDALHLEIKIYSTVARRVNVAASSSDGITAQSNLELKPGVNTAFLELPAKHTGLLSIRVAITDVAGAPIDENVIASQVDRPSGVVVVREPDTVAQVAPALSNILGGAANVRDVTAADLSTLSLEDVDTLVLDDLSLDSLSLDVQRSIRQAVSGGLGLLVVGIDHAFSSVNAPLAATVPLKLARKIERIDPSVALVLILDTSASMRGEKLDLAKAVARIALGHLGPVDKVGLVEFYGGKRWAAPLQSAANSKTIDRALARLTAGGGTTLYPAVEEAGFALRNVDTQGKHILILSDGFVEEAPFESLVRDLADEGISVSAVGVKADPQERNLMPAIAQWGRGRYYTVPDRFAVPDLSFKKPTLSPLPMSVNQDTSLTLGNDSLARSFRGEHWGSIAAYARTSARAGAEVSLRTASGDPIVAHWHYGDGNVAAVATTLSAASESGGLKDRAAFTSLIASLMRQISGDGRHDIHLTPTVRPAGVEIDAVLPTPSATDQSLHLEVLSGGKVIRSIDTLPTAASRWNTLVTGLRSGVYEVNATTNDTVSGSCVFSVPQPSKSGKTVSEDTLLPRIESFSRIADEHRTALATTRDLQLTRPLLLTAIALLLTHVALRRRAFSASSEVQ